MPYYSSDEGPFIITEILTNNRRDLYLALARVFEKEPDFELLSFFDTDAWKSLLGADVLDLPADKAGSEVDVFLEEYTRLFLGPGPRISPYASVQTGDHSLWGDTTAKIYSFIKDSGFKLRSASTLIPDHISIIFELMTYFINEESNQASAAERNEILFENERRILGDLLLPWTGKFFKEVIEKAELNFYKRFAELGEQFLGSEQRYLLK